MQRHGKVVSFSVPHTPCHWFKWLLEGMNLHLLNPMLSHLQQFSITADRVSKHRKSCYLSGLKIHTAFI